MTSKARSIFLGFATLTIVGAIGTRDAQAAWPWRHGRGHVRVIVAPAPVGYEQQYPYPYQPAPYYQPPAPPEPIWWRPEFRLSLAGVVQSPSSDQMPVGGVAAGLQVRTSTLTMMGLELQSLGARRFSGNESRSQTDGLVTGRFFLWDAPLVPFLEVAGGIGHASVEAGGFTAEASQLVGRVGLGLELRLGRHLVLEGELARTGRLTMGDPADQNVAYLADPGAPFIADHEGATEARAALSLRF
jgi:hypothetical protein